MLEWILVVISAFVGFGAVQYARRTILPRRRLKRFLNRNGVVISKIIVQNSYAWPGYIVVFDSLEKVSEFKKSPTFQSLIDEVGKMHKGLKLGQAKFEAIRAVSLTSYL